MPECEEDRKGSVSGTPAREGASDNLAPGSARGTVVDREHRGRAGGRNNRALIPNLVATAFTAANSRSSFHPALGAGLDCSARLRAQTRAVDALLIRATSQDR
jgi:hypothetical protein